MLRKKISVPPENQVVEEFSGDTLTLKPGMAVSLAELMDSVDASMDFYLRRLKQEGKAEASVWLEIFSKKPLSEQLRNLYSGQLDFSSDQVLSAAELYHLLHQELAGGTYNMFARCLGAAQIQQTARLNKISLLAAAGRLWFECDDITSADHMYIFENYFGDYLINAYFDRHPKPHNFKIDLHLLMTHLIPAIAICDFSEDDKLRFIHSLLFLLHSDADNATLETFLNTVLKAKETIPENAVLVDLDAALAEIRVLFQTHFPSCWLAGDYELKARIVRYKGRDKEHLEIVPPDNMYFDEPRNIEAPDDEFPPDGNIVSRNEYSKLICKDGSVFLPNGQKVFWGDLRHEDICHLKGVYYVLSQEDSFHQVPEDFVMVEALFPADDPHRPSEEERAHFQRGFEEAMGIPEGPLLQPKRDKVALHPDYVRLKARGRIENGVFVENSIRI